MFCDGGDGSAYAIAGGCGGGLWGILRDPAFDYVATAAADPAVHSVYWDQVFEWACDCITLPFITSPPVYGGFSCYESPYPPTSCSTGGVDICAGGTGTITVSGGGGTKNIRAGEWSYGVLPSGVRFFPLP